MQTRLVHADAKQRCGAFRSLLNYDLFGSAVGLNYPGGEGEYQTCWGACATFLISVITFIFLVQSVYTLWMYKGTALTTVILQDAHDLSYQHTEEAGFQIAIGVNGGDIDAFQFVTFTVGVLGVNDEGPFAYELDTHKCTESEL